MAHSFVSMNPAASNGSDLPTASGAAKNTITKLLGDVGEACAEYQDGVLQSLPCKVLEVDEIWSFCYAKQKNVPEQLPSYSAGRQIVRPDRCSG